jgi:hypothetical protein
LVYIVCSSLVQKSGVKFSQTGLSGNGMAPWTLERAMPRAPPRFPMARTPRPASACRSARWDPFAPNRPFQPSPVRPHTTGRSVAVPTSRRHWAAIGCYASPPPCSAHTVDGRDPLSKAQVPIKAVKLAAARIAQAPSRHCRHQWCPRRAPPSGRLHRQRVLLLPTLGSPVAPPFACCSGRATNSPEQSSQRSPPPASATPDRWSPLRRE